MAKQILSALLLVFVLTLSGYAQEVKQPIFVGVTVGGALGLDGFGKTTATQDSTKISGFASYGYSVNLQGGYYFNKNIAAAARFGFNSFFFNTNKYQTILKDQTFPGYSTTEAKVEDGSYSGLNFLVGPRLALPVGSLEFYLQPMIGYSTLTPSTLKYSTVTVQNGTSNYVATTTEFSNASINSGLATSVSLGLRTGLTSKVGFLLDINYLNLGNRDFKSSSESKNTFTNGQSSITYKSPESTGKIAIASVSVNLGVSIGF